MKKHKKFIKDLYNEKEISIGHAVKQKILERYPEFREEFKVGEWIKSTSGRHDYLMVWNDGKKTYGFWNGNWGDDWLLGNDKKPVLRKATYKEVRGHLIKEAERRQLGKLGFEGLNDSGTPCLYKLSEWCYQSNEDKLWSAPFGYGGKLAYHNGKWAKTIPTMTKEEAEKKLNVKII